VNGSIGRLQTIPTYSESRRSRSSVPGSAQAGSGSGKLSAPAVRALQELAGKLAISRRLGSQTEANIPILRPREALPPSVAAGRATQPEIKRQQADLATGLL
jgi:hypothetical protein